mmetsp:Transcript_7378/g.15061  ORF Transcript_7378/g.15061 Transcript_7378/m.15061 type:complete len:164 (+) Transcript_7378:1755-2246(+)
MSKLHEHHELVDLMRDVEKELDAVEKELTGGNETAVRLQRDRIFDRLGKVYEKQVAACEAHDKVDQKYPLGEVVVRDRADTGLKKLSRMTRCRDEDMDEPLQRLMECDDELRLLVSELDVLAEKSGFRQASLDEPDDDDLGKTSSDDFDFFEDAEGETLHSTM